MNKVRRKNLQAIIDRLEELKGSLEDLQAEEEEYRDNIPENMQESERYEKADEACDNLSSAVDSLEEAISSIEAAIRPDDSGHGEQPPLQTVFVVHQNALDGIGVARIGHAVQNNVGHTVGAYAKDKINAWITEFKENSISEEEMQKKIALIGEPIIQRRLEQIAKRHGINSIAENIRRDERQSIIDFLKAQQAALQHQIQLLEAEQR